MPVEGDVTTEGIPRVLLVITQSELGGAQLYVLKVARDLTRRGASVVIVCGQDGPLVSAARADGIDVRVLPYLVRPIRPMTDLRAIVHLWRLIRTGRFTIVHLNSTKAGVVGRLAARFAGADIVFFTVHGLVLNEPMSKAAFALYWILERIGAMATTRLIAVSEADRAALLRYRIARPDKIAVVQNGVPTSWESDAHVQNSRALARARLGIPETVRVVGTVANYYRTKALDVLIEAVPDLIKGEPDIIVMIVGDGAERSNIEAQIDRLDLRHRIRLVGSLPDVMDILPAFDVFVLPSRKEGLPMALLEAMAAGLPVVVTRVGGMPEVVTLDCGRIVEPEDARALASAVREILDDRMAALQCGRAGRARVAAKFSEHRMLEETAQIYDSELRRVGAASFPPALRKATR